MISQLLIFPFNGNGLEALQCLGSNFEFVGFVDDTPEKHGKNELGFEVFDRQAFADFPNAKVLAVPGGPSSFQLRKKIIAELRLDPRRFANVVSPAAVVSPYAKIGLNVLVMPGVVITSNCTIGDHVCILPNSVIHHDAKIGGYTLIGSNVVIAGATNIGEGCYIGSGSSIINGISVGNGCLVGMGTNVIKSVSDNSKLVGNPARVL